MEYGTEPRWLEVARAIELPGETRARRRRRRLAAAVAVGAAYLTLAAILGAYLIAAFSERPSGAAVNRSAPQPAAEAAPAQGLPVSSPSSAPRGNTDTDAAIRATFPFPPDPADRSPRPDEVVSLYADGLLCSIGCRPWDALPGWPLEPFHAQHPIRAALNELRPGSLHVGLDIQASDGQRVYAVQPGYARILERSGPDARIQVGNYIYWHINPVVAQGKLVTPFMTVLGTVMRGYGHVAFSEVGPRGQYLNPLRPLGTVLRPYADHARPVIGSPSLARDGQLVVPAYDPQSFVRRTTYLTPVLAPAALAYRLYDRTGSPVTPLEWAFRGTQLLPWAGREEIYAPGAHAPGYGCFATRLICVPNWTYRLAGGMAPPLPSWLPRGRYRLSVYAWDWANNETARDSAVTLTPAGWKPLGRFPASLLTAPGWTPYRYVPPTISSPELEGSLVSRRVESTPGIHDLPQSRVLPFR